MRGHSTHFCSALVQAFYGVCRAPEQADAELGSRGPHTDVWGFAACMLHLATGQPPYHNLSQLQMLTAMIKKRQPEIPTSLPAWMQQALQQCFSFDTAARLSVSRLHQVFFESWQPDDLSMIGWATNAVYIVGLFVVEFMLVACTKHHLLTCSFSPIQP